jgi:hypothetical protein
MFRWLLEKFQRANGSPLTKWSVTIDGEFIVTGDGSGTIRRLSKADLRKVVVQTDGSGPWGADVLFFLFGNEPAAVFQ